MTETTPSYVQTRWSLDDLMPSGNAADIDAAFAQLQEKVTTFAEQTRTALQQPLSVEQFLDILHQLEEINLQTDHLYGYASLAFSADTQDQVAQALLGRVQQFAAEMQNQILFFELWWKQLSDEEAGRFLAQSGDYRYWLEQIRLFKKYTLSEAEEKIINIKDVTGFSALSLLYDSITNRYTFKLTIDGQEQEMTRGELMVYVRQSDPAVRAQAYQELYRVYGNDAPILGQIYQTMVRDWYNENVQIRGFATPMSARNLANDIPDEVVDTLLDVCQRNASIFQRYFKLKARCLGVERLRRYDVYAPVAQADKRYSFADAAQKVFQSFREFDPEFAALAERVFAQNHLDSEIRKGKSGGAFCSTVDPKITPWVLLNYQGRSDDMATMAHELGHAIHSMLAAGHTACPWQRQPPPSVK
jgi:oligoendopeptidase F